MIDWIRHTLLAEGMISDGDVDRLHLVDEPAEAVRLIVRDDVHLARTGHE